MAWNTLLKNYYRVATDDHPIVREVKRLSEQAGIKTPPNVHLQIADVSNKPGTNTMFRYMIGVLPRGKDMVFGTSAYNLFGGNYTSEEMSAVIAHELGHIKHHDVAQLGTKRLANASPFLGMAIAMTALSIYENYKKRKTRKEHDTEEEKLPGEEGYSYEQEAEERDKPLGRAMIAAKYLAAAALGLIAGTFVAKLLNNHMEYSADKYSAQLMGSGKPLARALEKFYNHATQRHQSMENSGVMTKKASRVFYKFFNWLSHPDITKRIDRLHSM